MTQELVVFEPAEDQKGTMFGDPLAFKHALGVAGVIAQSSFVPAAFRGKVGDVLIAVDMAQRLRLSPMMVLQNLVVIHGTPSWKAAFLLALAQSRGWDVDYEVERLGEPLKYKRVTKDATLNAQADNLRVTCILRRGSVVKRGVPVTTTQAIAAGWANNEQYTHSTELMLRYRAGAFAVRQFEPAAMLGLMTEEEAAVLTVVPEAEPMPASAKAMPKTIDAIVEQVNQAAPSPEVGGSAAGGGSTSAPAAAAAPSSDSPSSGREDGAASDLDASERAALIAEIKELARAIPEPVRDRIKIDHGLARIPKNAKIEKLRLLVLDLRSAVRVVRDADLEARDRADREAAALDAHVDATDPNVDDPPPTLTAEQRVDVEQSCRALEKTLGPDAWQGVRRHQEIGLAEALTTMSHSRIIAYHSALQAIEAGEGDYFEDDDGGGA